MARNTVTVDHLAEAVMKGLTEYADASTELVKQSVQQVSKEVKRKYRKMRQRGLVLIKRAGPPRK